MAKDTLVIEGIGFSIPNCLALGKEGFMKQMSKTFYQDLSKAEREKKLSAIWKKIGGE